MSLFTASPMALHARPLSSVSKSVVVCCLLAGQVGAVIANASPGDEAPNHHVTPICEWEWADSRVMELLWTPLDPSAPHGRAAASAVCDPEAAAAAYREDLGDPPPGMKITSYLAVDRLGVGLPIGPALDALSLSDLREKEFASLPPAVLELLRQALLAVSKQSRASRDSWLELDEVVRTRLEEVGPVWWRRGDNHHAIGREMRMRPDEVPQELGLSAELLRRYAFSAPWVEPVAEIGADFLSGLSAEHRGQLARAVATILVGRYWFSMTPDHHLRTAAELGLESADLADLEVEILPSCPVALASDVASADEACDLRDAASELFWAPLDRATPSVEVRAGKCPSGLRREQPSSEEAGEWLPAGFWIAHLHNDDFYHELAKAELPLGTVAQLALVRDLALRLEGDHVRVTQRAREIVEAALADRPQPELVTAWKRDQLPAALRGREAEVAAKLSIHISVIEAAATSWLPPRVCAAAAVFELLDPDQREALAKATPEAWQKVIEKSRQATGSP